VRGPSPLDLERLAVPAQHGAALPSTEDLEVALVAAVQPEVVRERMPEDVDCPLDRDLRQLRTSADQLVEAGVGKGAAECIDRARRYRSRSRTSLAPSTIS
jgi:hypothetical protein